MKVFMLKFHLNYMKFEFSLNSNSLINIYSSIRKNILEKFHTKFEPRRSYGILKKNGAYLTPLKFGLPLILVRNNNFKEGVPKSKEANCVRCTKTKESEI